MGVGDPPDSLVVATLGVEDAGQEALAPVERGGVGPADEPLDYADLVRYCRADRHHLPPCAGGLRKEELGSADVSAVKVVAGPVQGLFVGECQTEAMGLSRCPARSLVRVGG